MCEWRRFLDKVTVEPVPWATAPGPCWVWHGATSQGGLQGGRLQNSLYTSFWYDGQTIRAHIWVAWAFGIIPDLRVPEGMNLDHTCQNTLCVCPWHLELVPKRVNLERRTRREHRQHSALSAEGNRQ